MRIMIDTNIFISAILFSSIFGDVDYLITGDKYFFDIEIERPIIMTAKDFLKRH